MLESTQQKPLALGLSSASGGALAAVIWNGQGWVNLGQRYRQRRCSNVRPKENKTGGGSGLRVVPGVVYTGLGSLWEAKRYTDAAMRHKLYALQHGWRI